MKFCYRVSLRRGVESDIPSGVINSSIKRYDKGPAEMKFMHIIDDCRYLSCCLPDKLLAEGEFTTLARQASICRFVPLNSVRM
jgi:hypothetical protein